MQRKNNSSKRIVKGQNFKIGIVVSSFNCDITEKMLAGAEEVLQKNGVQGKNIKVLKVPGSFEIPLACQRLAKSKKFDGLIAIGCVIKGDTDHYYYISSETIGGIMRAMLDNSTPIGLGVITTNNLKQAKDRSGKMGNKGAEAAQAVLEMLVV